VRSASSEHDAATSRCSWNPCSVYAVPSGSTYFLRTPDGQLLSERSAAGTYYYLGDALGSVMALTNSAGSVVNTYAYDPYGASTASTGSPANPFGYGGQQLDRASATTNPRWPAEVPRICWPAGWRTPSHRTATPRCWAIRSACSMSRA
jgi:hypothetical protein